MNVLEPSGSEVRAPESFCTQGLWERPVKCVMGSLLLLSLALGSWYYFSPRWTLASMQAAAEQTDGEELAGYIDFPSLRESVKQQLMAEMVAEIADRRDSMAALGGLMVMGMVDNVVEATVSLAALQLAMNRHTTEWGPEPAGLNLEFGSAEIVRDGFSQFRLRQAGRPDLVFERYGLGWKLTGIRTAQLLPADASERRDALNGPGVLDAENSAAAAPSAPALGADTSVTEAYADSCAGHYLNGGEPGGVAFAIEVTNRPLGIEIRFADFGSITAMDARAAAPGQLEFADSHDGTRFRVRCRGDAITVEGGGQTFEGRRSDEELVYSEDGF